MAALATTLPPSVDLATTIPRTPDPLTPPARTEDEAGRSGRKPGWALTALFVGYPLWWILGVTQIVALIAALALGRELLQVKRISLPRGTGWWLLYLVWVVVGVLVLQVNAPGAIPGASGTRYLTWGLRGLWYLEATVVLLYIATMRKAMPAERVFRIFSWMFVTTVLGGLAGSIAPALDLHSVVELLLPHHLTANSFVSAQVHPTLAERQVYLGNVQYRTSAPFTNANEWGLSFVCFLPFFVVSWGRRGAGWRRIAMPVVLAISVVPVIYSLNRGLWAALLLSACLVAVQHALAGHYKTIVAIGGALLAVVLLVVVSPLSGTLQQRFSGHNSDTGRTNLGVNTITSVAQASPIVGFGTTRQVQGSFYSIAGGSSPACPNCSPPALGTQGFVWFAMFGNGFAGAFVCLAFFVFQFFRYLRLRSPWAVASQTVLLAFLVTLPIYDWSITAAMVVMAAVALLWRESLGPEGAIETPEPGSLASSLPDGDEEPFATKRLPLLGRADPRGLAILLACTIAGAGIGGAWRIHEGRPFVAHAEVLVPSTATVNVDGGVAQPLTLDSEARFMDSPPVLAAVSGVVGHQVSAADTPLRITATANTKVLVVSASSTSATQAQDVVAAATHAYLGVRAARVAAEESQALTELRRQQDATNTALQATIQALQTLPADSRDPSTSTAAAHLQAVEIQLQTTAASLVQERSALLTGRPPAATQLMPATAYVAPHARSVAISSGLVLGLSAGLLLLLARRRWWLRVDRLRRPESSLGMPCLLAGPGDAEQIASITGWASARHAEEYLSVGSSEQTHDLAMEIDAEARRVARLPQPVPGRSTDARRVVLVASPRTRPREVASVVDDVRWLGGHVVGLVIGPADGRRFYDVLIRRQGESRA